MPKERVERDEEDLVRLYLTDIGQYPLLTKDDEVRLAQAIEAGNEARGHLEAGGKEVTPARKRELRRTVTREVDAGLETLEVDLQAVVTTDLRLNEPRFIKLPDIMKAKSKPLETIAFADLGVDTGDTLKTTGYAPPPKRSRGVMVKDAAELVAALKSKGLL